MSSCVSNYPNCSVIHAFIVEQYFNMYNLINLYDPENIYDYTHHIFNSTSRESERLYIEFSLTREGVDFTDLLPECAEYVKERGYCKTDFLDNLVDENWYYFFCLYAISLGDNIVEKFHKNFNEIIEEYYNNYNKLIFDLAIRKLRRNKIVNHGFLLKVSIMKCGMF